MQYAFDWKTERCVKVNTPKKVGYGCSSSSGISLKIYEGTRFIGTISYSDIEKTRKSRNFVCTMVKYEDYQKPEPSETKPTMKEADPQKLNFSLNLFEKEEQE
jgi:hypothetical protein